MTSSPSTENRAGYDRWAAIYDSYTNSTVATDDLYFPPLYAGLRHDDVLEIGCGTGRHTLRLAEQGNRVTALDLSPGMLAEARRKLHAHPDVRLIEADILEGGDFGRFDAVLSALVLEHIAEPTLFFRRAADALKPGGRFYLSEIHPDRIAAGTQANFTTQTGDHVRLTSFAHSEQAIQSAATAAGLTLAHHQDIIGGDDLVAINPDWARHRGRAMIRIWIYSLPAGGSSISAGTDGVSLSQ